MPETFQRGVSVPASLHDLIHSLRNAIRDELHCRQSSNQGRPLSVPLLDGRVQGRFGRHQRVTFRTTTFPLSGALDDTQGELIIDGQPHPCVILGLSVDQLTLSLIADLQPEIPQARLTIDRIRLLLALDKRLAAIQGHPQDYLTELALKCFTPSSRPTPLADRLDIAPDPSLNPEQFTALVRALTHDFLYLWGPPGTGKTQVIGAVTRLAMERGDRVLICSNTNTAVDEALEAVLRSTPATSPGQIVRYGLAADDAPAPLHAVTMEHLAAQETAALAHTLAQLQQQAAPIQEETARLESLRQLHDDLIASEEHAQTLHAQLAALQHDITTLRQTQDDSHAAVTRYTDELHQYWTASRWRRLFLRRQSTIQADLFDAQLIESDCAEDLLQLTAQLDTLQQRITDTLEAKRVLAQRFTSQLGTRSITDLPQQLASHQAQAIRLHQDITELQHQIATVERRILQHCTVLATTITRTYTAPVLEHERFDLVIIDEGSTATPPALFASLCLARRQVLIVGDFFQLSPIAESQTLTAKQWLATDIYGLTGIKNDNDPRVAALTTQYRMHPDIATLAAKLYQRAGLSYRTDRHIRTARQTIVEQSPAPGKALVFVDTSDAQPWVDKDHKGSPSNHYHATVAVALAQQALRLPSSTQPTVSIIAPYRNQVRLLQDLISQADLSDHVHVGTIHSVQGQQSDIVIFDTTVTGNLTKTMLGRCESDRSPSKLINVAFTRAKSKLIIIGHRPSITTLSNHPDSLLWEALQTTDLQGGVMLSHGILHPVPVASGWSTPPEPHPTPITPGPVRSRGNRLYLIRRDPGSA